MTLRRVTLLIILTCMVALVGALHVVARSTVVRSFARIEEQETRDHVARARDALHAVIDNLDTKSADWAAWDDCYKFVQDGNEAFRASNLNIGSLSGIDVDAMLFFDSRQRLVSGVTIDREGHALRAAPGSLIEALRSNDNLLEHRDPAGSLAGLLAAGEDDWVLSSRPIVTSGKEGPVRGTLVFGHLLSAESVRRLGERVHLRLEIERASGSTSGAGGARDAGHSGDRRSGSRVQIVDERTIRGDCELADVVGTGAYRVGITTDRPVYRQSRATEEFLLGSMVVCGVLIAVLLLLTLRRVVQRPIENMLHDLSEIVGDLRCQRTVRTRGVLELRALADAINRVLRSHRAAIQTLDAQTQTLRVQATDLSLAKANAEAAVKSKNEFFASISHEIRTPMTAILGFADMLAEDEVTVEDRKSCIATIRRNGETLLSMISDILDLAKLEASGMTVEMRPVNPVDVANDAFELLRPIASKKKLTYEFVRNPDLPPLIAGDSVRLKQILVNLLGNAIKFTESGFVRLRARRSPSVQQHLLFEVQDSGIGMTEEQVERLFQPFTQAEASTSRRFGGTGLGLTISKRLAHLMSGDISVKSEPGAGSTFTIALQIVLPAATESGASVEDGGNGGDGRDGGGAGRAVERGTGLPACVKGSAGRVLLAEDGDDNRRLIVHILTKAGYQVDTAVNGVEAVNSVLMDDGDEAVQLVLMDMSMPLMDGYEAVRVLRLRGFGGPIIALTAHTGDEQIARCLDAGCDDYATKPVSRDEFLALCRRWIGQRHGRLAA